MSGTALGEFLRARREQLRPEDVGLAWSGRRRVPGLRREELAMLAGVSADYYLRLEQGRDIRPSAPVVDALARALQLEEDATAHLHALASRRAERPRGAELERAAAHVERLIAVRVQASLLAFTTSVNGAAVELRVASHETLLDVLRDRLGLTGTKKGCDQGACGACTVLVDGKRVLSCLTLAIQCDEREVTTIEGLGDDGELHPLQEAFVRHDALQCGYCTPGQIMSAVALLAEGRARSDAEIREFMSGNLCRCGAYPNIVAAIREVAGR